MALNLDVAVSLVKQAIDQDKKKNYEEAARCYREAIIIFKTTAQLRNISKGVRQAIGIKCAQYEERLKKLDKYLLANADLSQLFKDVVDQNKRPDSQNSSSDGSISSESWKGLKNCPLYRQGIEAIERGKKRDKKGQYEDALHYYEDGFALLLEAAEANGDDPNAAENNEHLRFKCLLIHERIEMIRYHLDVGQPLKPINDSLAPTEYSFDKCGSPEPHPEDEEEHILESSELGSVQSLNRQEKMPKTGESMESLSRNRQNETPSSIPLADLDSELQLSSMSLRSAKSLQSIKSYCGSIKAVGNDSTFSVEADRNVTELTITNSELDIDAYLNESSDGNVTPVNSSTGSDSGISDQSPILVDQACPPLRSRHTSSAYTSCNEDEAIQVHRVEDGTLVVGTSPSRSSPPAIKLSSLKRAAKVTATADELTVLSQEDVVDTALMAAAATSKTKVKNEQVPPRILAGQPGYDDDEDEHVNKGCLYFVACLDALWIL